MIRPNGCIDLSYCIYCTCVAKLAPDENPPTVMVFASIEGTFGKELPEGGGGVGVRHPWDKVTL